MMIAQTSIDRMKVLSRTNTFPMEMKERYVDKSATGKDSSGGHVLSIQEEERGLC